MKNCSFADWLKAAGIRAVKTFAQTAASLITVGAILSEISWGTVFSAAAVAAILSLLTSVAGLPELARTTMSLPLRRNLIRRAARRSSNRAVT